MPYFPAERFKDLLYESAVEVYEMFELAGMSVENLVAPENIFHRNLDDNGNVSAVQIIVPNFYICPREEYRELYAEWKYLQSEYEEIFRPTDVLESFTSVRYQTQLENRIEKYFYAHVAQ